MLVELGYYKLCFVKEPQLFYGKVLDVFGLTHSFSITYSMDLNLGARFLLGGRIVTPRVFKYYKQDMSSYALLGIGHIANFNMHSLKQVYIYVLNIARYCLNQVRNLYIDLKFRKP